MHTDCIFCKIIANEIPATRIIETDSVLAFLDIGPIIKGHTLVIPKSHHDPLTDVPSPLLSEMMDVAKSVMQAQLDGLKADGVNIIQNNGVAAGQAVMHVHFHVIPRFTEDGHHWNWNAGSYGSPQEATEFADRIKDALPRT